MQKKTNTAMLAKDIVEIVQTALKAQRRTQASLAGQIGMSPQTFSKKITSGNLGIKKFFEAIDALGLVVTLNEKDSGVEIKRQRAGVLPRITKMIDRVRYDTFNADALCHWEILVCIDAELYRDSQGRHFVVINMGDDSHSTLTTCTANVAQMIYGTIMGDCD